VASIRLWTRYLTARAFYALTTLQEIQQKHEDGFPARVSMGSTLTTTDPAGIMTASSLEPSRWQTAIVAELSLNRYT